MAKPLCVIVTGRPGAGKTTLALELGRTLRLPVISRDAIKEGYVHTRGVPHDQLPPDTNAIVTNLFFDLTRRYLAGQVSIVIEAAFQHPVWSQHIPGIADLSRPKLILCTLDPHRAAERHLARGLADPAREFHHGDARVAEFRRTGQILPPGDYAPPTLDHPTLSVDTTTGYNPTLDHLTTWLTASR